MYIQYYIYIYIYYIILCYVILYYIIYTHTYIVIPICNFTINPPSPPSLLGGIRVKDAALHCADFCT